MRKVTVRTESEDLGNLFGSLTLSYLIAAGLFAGLVWACGIWNLLANTRLLDILIRGGIVALTDADQGIVHGVPDIQYYLASQDDVDLGLLLIVATTLFLVIWVLRGVQFHGFVAVSGRVGSFRDHMRAYLYGTGVDRVLPFDLGTAATASALEGQGASAEQAGQAAYLPKVFSILEIVFLGFVGLALTGWTTLLGTFFWAFVILGAAHLMMRGTTRQTAPLAWGKQALAVLGQQPARFARLAALSLFAAALEPVAAYVVSQAFTSPNVILNVEIGVLVLAIACGRIAQLVKVTPSGFGQGEWAFAAALFVSGVGMPEAVTIAILYSFVRYAIDFVVLSRYIVGTLVLGSSVTFGFAAESSIRGVLIGRPDVAEPAPKPVRRKRPTARTTVKAGKR